MINRNRYINHMIRGIKTYDDLSFSKTEGYA